MRKARRRKTQADKAEKGVFGTIAEENAALDRLGGDLLSRVLGHSTIGAEGFHGRVRDGIGCLLPRHNHQANQASHALRPRRPGPAPLGME
jgi:hypothetical protein